MGEGVGEEVGGEAGRSKRAGVYYPTEVQRKNKQHDCFKN